MSFFHRLVRQFYPHGSVRTVLRGPLRGLRFVAMPGMAATYALGLDHLNLPFLSTQVRAGDVIYDVGGNCGQMALYFSRVTGADGRVYSFEPVPQNAAVFRRNMELNGISNVELTEAAVSSSHEPQVFCFDDSDHTMGTLRGSVVTPGAFKTELQVSCLTLDSFLEAGARPPKIVKIDVEGSGLGVVEGAVNLFEKHRPAVYFEIHASQEDAPELRAVRMLQDRWGYRIKDLSGKMPDGLRPVWGAPVWCEPAQGI